MIAKTSHRSQAERGLIGFFRYIGYAFRCNGREVVTVFPDRYEGKRIWAVILLLDVFLRRRKRGSKDWVHSTTGILPPAAVRVRYNSAGRVLTSHPPNAQTARVLCA